MVEVDVNWISWLLWDLETIHYSCIRTIVEFYSKGNCSNCTLSKHYQIDKSIHCWISDKITFPVIMWVISFKIFMGCLMVSWGEWYTYQQYVKQYPSCNRNSCVLVFFFVIPLYFELSRVDLYRISDQSFCSYLLQ